MGEGVELLPSVLGNLPFPFPFPLSFSLSKISLLLSLEGELLGSKPPSVLGNALGNALASRPRGGQFSVIISLGVG